MSVRVGSVLLAGIVVVVALGVVGSGGAHGTHVDVTPQIASDGQLMIDGVNTARDGFLVIHRNDGGDPGESIGHVALQSGFTEDLSVPVSGDWDGPTTLWAVVHGDDGDGEYEPDTDEPIRSLGGVAGRQFQARRAARPVYLLTHSANAQPSNRSVLINATAMDGDGFVVVHGDDRGQLGDVVGNRSVQSGVTSNVVVDVANGTYDGRRNYYRLWAVLYEDDGDGRFDPEADSPVTVGGEPVADRFQTRVVPEQPSDWRAPLQTPSPTETADDSGGSGPGGASEGGSTTASGDGPDSAGDDGTEGGSGDGFGVAVAVLAILGMAAVYTVRRRS